MTKHIAKVTLAVILIVGALGAGVVVYAREGTDEGTASKPTWEPFCITVRNFPPEGAINLGENVDLGILSYHSAQRSVPVKAAAKTLRTYVRGLQRIKHGEDVAVVQADPDVQAAIVKIADYANRRCT